MSTTTPQYVLVYWTSSKAFTVWSKESMGKLKSKAKKGENVEVLEGQEGWVVWPKDKSVHHCQILRLSRDKNYLEGFTVLEDGTVLPPKKPLPPNAIKAKKLDLTRRKRKENVILRQSSDLKTQELLSYIDKSGVESVLNGNHKSSGHSTSAAVGAWDQAMLQADNGPESHTSIVKSKFKSSKSHSDRPKSSRAAKPSKVSENQEAVSKQPTPRNSIAVESRVSAPVEVPSEVEPFEPVKVTEASSSRETERCSFCLKRQSFPPGM
ncbi:uncharacterized protein LOC113216869 [Frankliniella occidentalis]|uniref:Uncharacterized protein LOC113216869 n=1 Tax=Frankliniella occidentalis TaxID=133901 RepID=A0A9C6U3D6_FRAOC|nr:uncharacterized protein LOC113216869 [Frankliniella occidentalis]